jgi:hypothetical protein
MTVMERTLLQDLERLASCYGNRRVPQAIVHVVIEARKTGRPQGPMLNLRRRGFVKILLGENPAYSRTNKKIPGGTLIGEDANRLPSGSHSRVVMHWKQGVRTLTREHLTNDVVLTAGAPPLGPEPEETELIQSMRHALEQARRNRRGEEESSWGSIVVDHLLLERLHKGPIPSAVSKRLFDHHRPNLMNGLSVRGTMVANGLVELVDPSSGRTKHWRVTEAFRALVPFTSCCGTLSEVRATRILKRCERR